MELLKLIAVAGLIALTGFFVAVEFAIVKVRRTKIDQLIIQKKKGALAAKEVTSHLDEYLSACQLGITVTALGLGWLGEPTMQTLLHPLFSKIGLNESVTHILSFWPLFIGHLSQCCDRRAGAKNDRHSKSGNRYAAFCTADDLVL